MKRAEKKAKIKAARATQQINREANKIINQLKNELSASNQQLAELKKELVKTQQELKKEKASHKTTKQKLANKTAQFKSSQIKVKKLSDKLKTAKKAEKENATTGAFDAFGPQKGYRAGAQSAGNRIERNHPGFYDLVKGVGPRVLDDIWNYYARIHSTLENNFYDIHGEDYFDEEAYDVLCQVMWHKYQIEVLI